MAAFWRPGRAPAQLTESLVADQRQLPDICLGGSGYKTKSRENLGEFAMNSRDSFGIWLKQQRKLLGWTQKDLAGRAGCADVTLRKIEAGDLQPSAQLVAALSRQMGVADADLPKLVGFALGANGQQPSAARRLRSRRPHNLPA